MYTDISVLTSLHHFLPHNTTTIAKTTTERSADKTPMAIDY